MVSAIRVLIACCLCVGCVLGEEKVEPDWAALSAEIDARPGDVSYAYPRLLRLLADAPEPWSDQAASSLVALVRMGAITGQDERLVNELRALRYRHSDRGALFSASIPLAGLQMIYPASVENRLVAIGLLFKSGDRSTAARLYSPYATRLAWYHTDKVVNGHAKWFYEDKTMQAALDRVRADDLAEAAVPEAMEAALAAPDSAEVGIGTNEDPGTAVQAWWALRLRFATLAAEKRAEITVTSKGRLAEDLASAVAQWRAAPFDARTQQGLLAQAEAAVARGAIHQSEACFRDLIASAADPAMLQQAQRGLLLCLIAQDKRAAAEDVAAALPESFPWGAKEAKRSDVLAKLQEPAEPSVALSDVKPTAVLVPARAAWSPALFGDWWDPWDFAARTAPGLRYQRIGDRIIGSAPNLIVGFDAAKPGRPLWMRDAPAEWDPEHVGSSGRFLVGPGAWQPAVADGLIVQRWASPEVILRNDPARADLALRRNVRALRQVPGSIAAFSVDDGEMRWSTDDTMALGNWVPVCDPVIDGNRVYVVVKVPEGQNYRFALACLDLFDGRALWHREIGFATDYATGGSRERSGVAFNPSLMGAPPVFADGLMYWSSSAGFVVAIDPRDGLVLWRHDYEAKDAEMWRPGSAPLVADGLIAVVARDRHGVVALDRQNGSVRWSNPMVPAASIVGGDARVLVIRERDRLTGLAITTGDVLWTRQLDLEIKGEVAYRGQDLVFVAGDQLIRMASISGVEIERRSLPGGAPQADVAVLDDKLLMVAPQYRSSSKATHDHVHRETPRIAAESDKHAVLFSSGRVELIDLARGSVVWTRQRAVDLWQAALCGDKVLLLSSRGLDVVNIADGKRSVSHRFDNRVAGWRADAEGAIVVLYAASDKREVRYVQAASGKETMRHLIQTSDQWGHWYHPVAWQRTNSKVMVLMHHVHRDKKRSFFELLTLGEDGKERPGEEIAAWKGEAWSKATKQEDSIFWTGLTNGEVVSVDLAKGKVVNHGSDMHFLRDRNSSLRWSVAGQRAVALIGRGYNHSKQKNDMWGFFRHDRDKPLKIHENNDENYVAADAGFYRAQRDLLIRIGDDFKEQKRFDFPRSVAGHEFEPREWHALGKELLVLSRRHRLMVSSRGRWQAAEGAPNDADHLAIDRFGADGAHLGRLSLPDLAPHTWDFRSDDKNQPPGVARPKWSNQILWRDGYAWVSGPGEVRRVDYTQVPIGEGRAGHEIGVAFPLDTRLALDGDLDEWSDFAHYQREVRNGVLRVTHDRDNLLIGVQWDGAEGRNLIGAGRYGGGGEWIELQVRGNEYPGKDGDDIDRIIAVGIGADGQVALRGTVPKETQAAMRYDLALERWVVEVAIPIDSVSDPKRRLADDVILAVAGMRDGVPRVAWPRTTLRLHHATPVQEKAGVELASVMPKMSEAHTFLIDTMEVHIGDWPAGKDFVRDVVAGHTADAFGAMVLIRLHTVLAPPRAGAKPLPQVEEFAKELGFAEPVVSFYRKYATAEKKPDMRHLEKWDWPESPELTPEEAQRLFTEVLPRMGKAYAAAGFCSALIRARGLDNDAALEALELFLTQTPDHPRSATIMKEWWGRAGRVYSDENERRAKMDAMMTRAKIPWRDAYAFRRAELYRDHDYVRDFHVVGPFPQVSLQEYDYGVPLPPRLRQITLKERYRMPDRTLSWTPLTCSTARVPLAHWLGNPLEPSIAYAVVWVKSPDQRQVALEFAGDGPSRIWVNRRFAGSAHRGTFAQPPVVWLAKGWSAILVEQTMGSNGGWTFQLDIVERDGKGAVRDIEVMETKGHKGVAEPERLEPSELAAGLVVDQFRGSWDKIPDFENVEIAESGVTTKVDLSVTEHREHIGLRFMGYIRVDEMNFYTFSLVSDDGSRMLIGDEVVVNNDGLHGAEERFGTVTLKPGFYPIAVEFFENSGGEHLEAFWRPHGQPKAPLPTEQLFHRP